MPESHEHREVAEGFGAEAERYARTRPSYPQDLIARIAAASPGPHVVDVGCGTGIAARQFAAAGCEVLGVEVDARMAELAQGFPVEVAKFEDWDAGERTFDAVVSGQTWHWIDPVAGAAKAAAVLRPGGRLAVFWNVFQPDPALAEALTAVYAGVMPGPNLWASDPLSSYQPILAKTADGMRAAGFAEPEQWRIGLGAHLHPRRVAGPGAELRRAQPAPARTSLRRCSPGSLMRSPTSSRWATPPSRSRRFAPR